MYYIYIYIYIYYVQYQHDRHYADVALNNLNGFFYDQSPRTQHAEIAALNR